MVFSQNYFELFNMPEQFDLDKVKLAKHYRELQKQFHPDHFSTKPVSEQRQAVQFSSYINTAFQTLTSIVGRAEYLLVLRGESIDHQSVTVSDGAFLMLQMEWREKLAEIAESDADHTEGLLDNLSEAVQSESQLLQSQFQQEYNAKDFLAAKQTTAKLHFTEKMLSEVETVESKLFD